MTEEQILSLIEADPSVRNLNVTFDRFGAIGVTVVYGINGQFECTIWRKVHETLAALIERALSTYTDKGAVTP